MNKKNNNISKKIKNDSTAIDKKRLFLFKVLTISLPFFLIIILEILLRLFSYGGNHDLFIPATGDYSQYMMNNPYVCKRYFFMQSTVPNLPDEVFLKEKPENGYRIFVLGGSTTNGYPYGNNLMFPRILEFRLQDAFPDKKIEIINTATSAINSYTLLDFTDEIIENNPDAILLYAGHNEFYGALGVASAESLGQFQFFVRFYLKIKKYKTFLLMRDAIANIKTFIDKAFFKENLKDPTATLMERLVTEQSIPYKSTLYNMGISQFENNVKKIIEKAQKAGIEIILSEVVSNIGEQKPFISIEDTSFNAHTAFKKAQFYKDEGNISEAKKYYYLAKDYDALRFRASEDINIVINKLGEKYNIPVVPMKKTFEDESPNGLIGNNLMLEHLHPNSDGYFLMADAFFKTIKENKFISEKWNYSIIKPNKYYRENWGYSSLDTALSNIRIKVLKGGWPFKPKSVPNKVIHNYFPKNDIQKLALKVWEDKTKSLEWGHVELAKKYKKQKRYDLAFQEYKTLICMTPYNSSSYVHAADALIKMQKLDEALGYLKSSLKLEENGFAYKWIGTILLQRNEKKMALTYLERAVVFKPKDAQLLYNLCGAYALNSKYIEANKTLKKLEMISPDFPGIKEVRNQLNQLLKN